VTRQQRDSALAETLRARAANEHVPTSVLIRRILARAVREGTQPVLTTDQVAEIARRVMRAMRPTGANPTRRPSRA
jgi:hypothetical protein